MSARISGWPIGLVLCAGGLTGQTTAVQMKNGQGESIGTASSGDVRIKLASKDLPPGERAIHIHGLQNPMGPHAGDVPNFTVGQNGTASASIVAANATLTDGPHSVLTNGGTALAVHAKADDMKTDPAGAAGDRIACGIISK